MDMIAEMNVVTNSATADIEASITRPHNFEPVDRFPRFLGTMRKLRAKSNPPLPLPSAEAATARS